MKLTRLAALTFLVAAVCVRAAPSLDSLPPSEQHLNTMLRKRGLLKLSENAIGSIVDQTSFEEASRLKAVLKPWHDSVSSALPSTASLSLPFSTSSSKHTTSLTSVVSKIKAQPVRSSDKAKQALRRARQDEARKRFALRAELAAGLRKPNLADVLLSAKLKVGRPRGSFKSDTASARLNERNRKSCARRQTQKKNAAPVAGATPGGASRKSRERASKAVQTQSSRLPDFPDAAPPSPGHDFTTNWLADYEIA